MVQVLTQQIVRDGGFVVSEANGFRSRDKGTLVSGQTLLAGAVLGTITASGKYTQYNPGNSDGSQTVSAILWGNTDASGGDTICAVVTRDCEVNAGEINWFTGASSGQITAGVAGLATLGIIARASVPPS